MNFEEAVKVSRRASLLQLWKRAYPRYLMGRWVVCLVSLEFESHDCYEDGWVQITRTPFQLVESREELETIAREYYEGAQQVEIKERG